MLPAAPTFSLDLPFPAIMGVVNVTPDSFSDGGRFLAADAALEQALTLVREGAAIVDIGGESTRPGSEPVSADEELRRVLPVIEALAGSVGVPISVDTMKAEVARRALAAGAAIINDVSALRFDDEMVGRGRRVRLPGVPDAHEGRSPRRCRTTRATTTSSTRCCASSRSASPSRSRAACARSRSWSTPASGSARPWRTTSPCSTACDRFTALGRPVLLGASRKRFLGAILGAEPADRVVGTVATTVIGYLAGAHVFRVHDVKPNFEALRVGARRARGRHRLPERPPAAERTEAAP